MDQAETKHIEVKSIPPTSTLITKVILFTCLGLTCCGLPFLFGNIFHGQGDYYGGFYFLLMAIGSVWVFASIFAFFESDNAIRLDQDGIQVIVPVQNTFLGQKSVPGGVKGGNKYVDRYYLEYKLPDSGLYQIAASEDLHIHA